MPTKANITVKKADGTTDVVYTVITGAAGDSPAVFRSKTVGTTVAEQPSLLIRSKDNGPRSARRISCDFSWPLVTQDSGGNKVVTGRMTGTTSVLIPMNQPAANIEEQAAQFSNLIGSALIKASFAEGFAPA